MNTTPSSTPRISPTTTSDGIPVQQAPSQGNWPMPDQQVDGTRRAGNAHKRALVLAGGVLILAGVVSVKLGEPRDG